MTLNPLIAPPSRRIGGFVTRAYRTGAIHSLMLDFQIAGPVGIVIMLLLGAVGLPFPEELILLGAGIAAYPDKTALAIAIVSGWCGILLADSMIFFIGKHLGGSVMRHPLLGRHLTQERLVRFEAFLARKGPSIILALRFMTGVRAPAFFSAGAMRFPYRRFIFFDAIGALVSAPAFAILGYVLGQHVVNLEDEIGRYQAYVPVVIGVALALYIFYRWWKGEQGKTLPPE